MSALLGAGAVLVWNDVADEGRERFYDWHDKEPSPSGSPFRGSGGDAGTRSRGIRRNG